MDFIQDRTDLIKRIMDLMVDKHQQVPSYSSDESEVKSFLKNMQEMEIFDFFPYKNLSVEMVAQFVANHLYLRKYHKGADKEDHSFRQMMDNLRRENFFNLRKTGLTDTFIIGRDNICDDGIAKRENDVPVYWHDDIKLLFSAYNFDVTSDDTKALMNMREIKLSDMEARCNAFIVDMTYLFRQKHHVKCDRYKIHYDLLVQDGLINYINCHINSIMLLFVLYNKNIEDKQKYLDDLSIYADQLDVEYMRRINNIREEWVNNNLLKGDDKIIKELSLEFSYYLHQLIETGFDIEITQYLAKEINQETIQGDNNDDASNGVAENHLENIRDNNGINITERQNERLKDLAQSFFPSGFDSIPEGLEERKMAFGKEIFIRQPKYKKMYVKLSTGNTDDLNNIMFKNASFVRGHMYQRKIQQYYLKYHEVLFKFHKITYMTYYSLNPEESIMLLGEFFDSFLEFFKEKGINKTIIE